MDVYERFLNYWWAGKLEPVSEEAVRQTFAELCFPLSADVLRLCRMIGGIDDFISDGNMLCIWPLARIRQDNASPYRTPGLLWFADWMISAQMYGFYYEDPDTSSVYVDYCSPGEERQIASSVEGFLDLYLTNPQATEAHLP